MQRLARPKATEAQRAMYDRAHVVCALAVSLLACTKTEIGSTCQDLGCKSPPSCKQAKQQSCSDDDGGVDAGSCASEQTCDDCLADNTNKYRLVNTPMMQCGCAYCAPQLKACFDSPLHGPGEKGGITCKRIVECALENNCSGAECYCGRGVTEPQCNDDAKAGHLRGPCASLIKSVSGCGDSAPCVLNESLSAAATGTVTVLYLATQVALCMGGDPYTPPAMTIPPNIYPMCPISTFGNND